MKKNSNYKTYDFTNLPKGKTNWEKVCKMTDSQIAKAAKSDPDAPLLTKKELSEFRRVNPKNQKL